MAADELTAAKVAVDFASALVSGGVAGIVAGIIVGLYIRKRESDEQRFLADGQRLVEMIHTLEEAERTLAGEEALGRLLRESPTGEETEGEIRRELVKVCDKVRTTFKQVSRKADYLIYEKNEDLKKYLLCSQKKVEVENYALLPPETQSDVLRSDLNKLVSAIEARVTPKERITETLDPTQQGILCNAAQNDGVVDISFTPGSPVQEVPAEVKQLEASYLLEQLSPRAFRRRYLLTLDGWHLALQYGQQNSTSTGFLTRLRLKLRSNIERFRQMLR